MCCATVSSLTLPIIAKMNNKERIISVEYFKERHVHWRICSQRLILHRLKSYILRQRKCWEISQMNFYTWINTRVKNWHILTVTTLLGLSVLIPEILTVLLKSPWLLSTQRPTQCRQAGQGYWMHRGLSSQIWISTWLFNKLKIWYIQNLAAILSPQSVPLKGVLFLINATVILLVVQTRNLVICDSFISLNPIHQKIFLGLVSKYI